MIPITPIDILRNLAALAPADERAAGPAGSPAPAAGASSPRGQGDSTLGPLDVARYLSAHGIEHKLKRKDDADFYVLRECLFDPGHRNGESAIVSGSKGLFYQCFHNSCADRTWHDARALISGDKKLTEWMEGYDPNYKRKRKKEEKALVPTGSAPGQVQGKQPDTENRYARLDNLINNDWPIVTLSDGTPAPTPAEVDPSLFFTRRGDRTEFVPRRAANYIIEQLFPLAYSTDKFWKYSGGVWRDISTAEITAILTHALKDQVKGNMVKNVVEVLKGLLYVREELWEPNPYLINMENGMLDVETMKILEHSPSYRSRVQLPISYVEQSPVGKWYEYLESIFPEDYEKDDQGQYTHYMEKHIVLQQFAGYCLLRDCRFQRALFLFGTGSNGKSTFLKVMSNILGKENTAALSLTSLKESFMTISLHNKLANLASETNPKAAMESEIFNSCVAGDEMQARNLYSQYLKFTPFCKFIISMNETPQVPDKSYAFQRRLIVLNFNRRFLPEELNPMMFEELMEEREGIFRWMVEGLKLLLKNNKFIIMENVQEDIDRLLTRVNPLIPFAEECCVFAPEFETRPQDLWDAYRDWCQEGGNRSKGKRNFMDQFESQFPKLKVKKGKGENRNKWVVMGVKLNSTAVDELRDRLSIRRQEKYEHEHD